jgi:hypothetical protein
MTKQPGCRRFNDFARQYIASPAKNKFHFLSLWVNRIPPSSGHIRLVTNMDDKGNAFSHNSIQLDKNIEQLLRIPTVNLRDRTATSAVG